MKLITKTLCAFTTILTVNAQTTTTYNLGSWASGFGDGSTGSSTGSNTFATPNSVNGDIINVELCYTVKFTGMVGADNHCSPVDGGSIDPTVWDGFYTGLEKQTGISSEDALHDAWSYDEKYGVITAKSESGDAIYYDINSGSWENVMGVTGDSRLEEIDEDCPHLNWTGDLGVSFFLPGTDQIDASTGWDLGPVAPGEWLMDSYSGVSSGDIDIDSSNWSRYLDGSLDVGSSILFTSAADVPQTAGALWGDTFDNGNGDFNYTIELSLKVTTVPEPSSTALLGLGALGFIARRKR